MSHEWAYAGAGLVLALGAPAGLLAVRVAQGAARQDLRPACADGSAGDRFGRASVA